MKVSFFGAAPDTGNLGVTALCHATLYNLQKLDHRLEVTIFDHGRGRRLAEIDFGDSKLPCAFQGAVNSKRYYRPENLTTVRFLAKLGIKISVAQTISDSNVVIDMSGGDSFTDIYGSQRFATVTLPKLLTLEQKKNLVLLPQTYGPFKTAECRNLAACIVKNAAICWARDARSFQVLKDLLGDSFDQNRHKCGVDVAFGLPTIEPTQYDEELKDFLDNDSTKIGLNVSGLIYKDQKRAKQDFGFRADYNKVVNSFVQKILKETDCNVCLVPHVLTPKGHYESDEDACKDVKENLSPEYKKRVIVVQPFSSPSEIKWVISKLDWFCGTRMHSTIAGLSTGVPTAAISYSPKALGVFETCGQGGHVADPTHLSDEEVVDMLYESWENRNEAKKQYQLYLPQVNQIINQQFQSILGSLS